MEFLSTLSLRRATALRGAYRVVQLVISIHALLAESDPQARRALEQAAQISIHALLAESDTMMTSVLT